MSPRLALRIAATLGFLAVALGAFGAHLLQPIFEKHQTAAIWQTASFYHLTHSLVILVLAHRPSLSKTSTIAFTLGILIFSGSLYALAVTGYRPLGMITPIGGLLLLTGWAVLFFQKEPKA